jgi:hypothetical protein
VKEELSAVLRLVVDAETGQRGYLITGDPVYLDPYQQATSQIDVDVWQTPDLQKKEPAHTEGLQVYSIMRMEQKYNSFTPEYGRAAGRWEKGRGKTYPRTIKVVFHHGTRDPTSSESLCSYYPPGYHHRKGYSSFWQYIWYAEGVGEVKETLLFDERKNHNNVPSCAGAGSLPTGASLVMYDDYIDDPH